MLFLHFQMPARKQNELIFNPSEYVNAQLPKLFCSLFKSLLASRINQNIGGITAHKEQKGSLGRPHAPHRTVCADYFTSAVILVGLREGKNTFRYFQEYSTGNHRQRVQISLEQ